MLKFIIIVMSLALSFSYSYAAADKSLEFINAQYYGVTPQQNLPILGLKIEYSKKLISMNKDASQKDKDELLEKYQKEVGKLLAKYSIDNALITGKMGLAEPLTSSGFGFCNPSADQAECLAPDGRVYKLDKSINQIERHVLKNSASPDEVSEKKSTSTIPK